MSPEDDYHVHIGSKEYFEIIFDDNKVSLFEGNYEDFINKIGWKDE